MTDVTFTVNRDTLEATTEAVINAPRAKVFKAYTDPEQLIKWWGPKRLTTEVKMLDLKPSGVWKFINRDENDNEFTFHGKYREIRVPSMISTTFIYDGIPGDHEIFQTTRFEDLTEGRTRVTTVTKYKSAEDLDNMINEGMESGNRESMERLNDLLFY